MVGTNLVFLFISFEILSGAYRWHIHALNIHLWTPRHIGSAYANIVEVATDLTIEYQLKKKISDTCNGKHRAFGPWLLVSRVEPLQLTTYANVRFSFLVRVSNLLLNQVMILASLRFLCEL
jgi:hypothetical protein